MRDLSAWRRETDAVDRLVAVLIARDGYAQAAAVRDLGDDDDVHRRVWTRACLILAWHEFHGAD